MTRLISLLVPAVLFAIASCSKEAGNTGGGEPTVTDSTTNDYSRLYLKMYNLVSMDTTSDTEVIFRTTDEPDHGTPFYGVGHPKYEAYNGDNPDFSTQINLGGQISDPTLMARSVVFTLPKFPAEAATHASTTGGPIGIARNGVVYFNQYNGNGAALDDLEINNADQYLGHPTPSNAGAQYHYHYEPKWLTSTFGNSSFMGFLLDGFPVYGPYENGVKITNSMLDAYHGHWSYTEDFTDKKVYHYHVTSASSSIPDVLKTAAPYINGGKYYGTKGTVN